MNGNNIMRESNVGEKVKVKRNGCWARFISLFEERGFDLEFEYNCNNTVNVLKENQSESEGYKKLEESRNSIRKKSEEIVNIDGELSGVINFYEQFASLNDDSKEEVLENKRRSTLRHRVSMRPSLLLTNIAEETADVDEEQVKI